MTTHTLNIQGMSCGHCVMSVRYALSKVAVVKEVLIGKAVVEIDDERINMDDLKRAVETAGYEVQSIA